MSIPDERRETIRALASKLHKEWTQRAHVHRYPSDWIKNWLRLELVPCVADVDDQAVGYLMCELVAIDNRASGEEP
jgi:hypothetical protein